MSSDIFGLIPLVESDPDSRTEHEIRQYAKWGRTRFESWRKEMMASGRIEECRKIINGKAFKSYRIKREAIV